MSASSPPKVTSEATSEVTHFYFLPVLNPFEPVADFRSLEEQIGEIMEQMNARNKGIPMFVKLDYAFYIMLSDFELCSRFFSSFNQETDSLTITYIRKNRAPDADAGPTMKYIIIDLNQDILALHQAAISESGITAFNDCYQTRYQKLEGSALGWAIVSRQNSKIVGNGTMSLSAGSVGAIRHDEVVREGMYPLSEEHVETMKKALPEKVIDELCRHFNIPDEQKEQYRPFFHAEWVKYVDIVQEGSFHDCVGSAQFAQSAQSPPASVNRERKGDLAVAVIIALVLIGGGWMFAAAAFVLGMGKGVLIATAIYSLVVVAVVAAGLMIPPLANNQLTSNTYNSTDRNDLLSGQMAGQSPAHVSQGFVAYPGGGSDGQRPPLESPDSVFGARL